MHYRIIFSDVDGTLLDSRHEMLPGTLAAVQGLQQKNIPFVIISARSPSGIYPILEKHGFQCPIIAYSGGLMMDEKRNIVFSAGFSKKTASDVILYIESKKLDCSWNVYSLDTWIVKDKSDPRIIREEQIVHAEAAEGNLDLLGEHDEVNKILCMCNPAKILEIETLLKAEFPDLSIVKSSDILLEIMQKGVTKSSAVTRLCDLWKIPLEETAAFGDHYNDVEMLETVGMPFLMGNAPEELKRRFPNVVPDNNSEGIQYGLRQIGLV